MCMCRFSMLCGFSRVSSLFFEWAYLGVIRYSFVAHGVAQGSALVETGLPCAGFGRIHRTMARAIIQSGLTSQKQSSKALCHADTTKIS